MNCKQLVEVINQYIDGEVDESICAQFEEHMAECQPCRVVVDTLRKTITLYKDDQEYELPGVVRHRLHETLRKHWKGPPSSEQ